jgi:hypothetical protein
VEDVCDVAKEALTDEQLANCIAYQPQIMSDGVLASMSYCQRTLQNSIIVNGTYIQQSPNIPLGGMD